MKEHPVRSVSQGITRRQLVAGSAFAGAALAMPSLRTAVAGQADLASNGYPTIDVTVHADSFEGIPETLEAGRYLVTITIGDDVKEGGTLAFLKPYEMTADEFFAFLGAGAPPAEASPAAEASPVAEEGGDEEEGPLPSFVYQSTFAGGVTAMSGTASAVVDLTEGEWIAWGDDPGGAQAPGVIQVTGEFPADAAEPDADVMVTLVDFGIMLDGNLVAGDHIFRIENQGAQPHFVDLSMVPAGTTNDDITALIDSFMTGTPEAGGLGEDDFKPVAFTPEQSIGTVTWHQISLEAGTYSAICWFPTAGIGDPHAFHGMHTVFDVTA